MQIPDHKPSDFGIGCPAFEDMFRILKREWPQYDSFTFQFGRFQVRRSFPGILRPLYIPIEFGPYYILSDPLWKNVSIPNSLKQTFFPVK
jgi:hypothetical protein